MKRCSHCGENYDDRVDFCFGDGTPLDALLDSKPAALSPTPAPAAFMAGLDAPDAENISGLDAPDPGGFSMDAPDPVVQQAPDPVVQQAPDPVVQQAPPVPVITKKEERQVPEPGEVPVGFFEPPSQAEASDALPSESDQAEYDDLDFPEGFGDSPFGSGDFGADFGDGDDFTDPTMPAPGARRKPIALIVGAIACVGIVLAVTLNRGGSESDDKSMVSKLQEPVVQPVRAVPEPVVEPAPILVEEEPETDLDVEEQEVLEGEGESNEVAVEVEPDKVELPKLEPAAPAIVKEQARPVLPKVSPVAAPIPSKQEASELGGDSESSPWGAVVAKAPSLVRIYSKPAGALVFVDGRQRGSTPAEVELDAGPHSIRVEKDGFFSESRELNVRKPSHLERFKLNARDQRVTVNCYGPDASKVYLDGQVICAIPGSGTLPAGRHTFRVVTPDRFFKMVVDVQARPDGSATPLRFTD
jgi:hypothetical protein